MIKGRYPTDSYSNMLCAYCTNGNLDDAIDIVKNYRMFLEDVDINRAFNTALEHGHSDILNFLTPYLRVRYMPHSTLERAAQIGNMYIVESLCQLTMYDREPDKTWTLIFVNLCRGGQVALIKHVWETHKISHDAVSTGYVSACEGGHMLVLMLLEDYDTDLPIADGFVAAAKHAQHDIIQYILQTATVPLPINTAMQYAAGIGDLKCYTLLSRDHIPKHNTTLFNAACRGANIDIIKLIIPSYGSNTIDWPVAAINASRRGSAALMEFIAAQPSSNLIDWSQVVSYASQSKNIDVLRYVLYIYPTLVTIGVFDAVSHTNDVDFMRYIISIIPHISRESLLIACEHTLQYSHFDMLRLLLTHHGTVHKGYHRPVNVASPHAAQIFMEVDIGLYLNYHACLPLLLDLGTKPELLHPYPGLVKTCVSIHDTKRDHVQSATTLIPDIVTIVMSYVPF
jgi:pentatricopeptide repeat protein